MLAEVAFDSPEANWFDRTLAICDPDNEPWGERLFRGEICLIKELESSAFLSWMLGMFTKQWSFTFFLIVSVFRSFFLKSFKSNWSVVLGLLGLVTGFGGR